MKEGEEERCKAGIAGLNERCSDFCNPGRNRVSGHRYLAGFNTMVIGGRSDGSFRPLYQDGKLKNLRLAGIVRELCGNFFLN